MASFFISLSLCAYSFLFSYFYHSWWHVWRRGFYSLVLTKAAFFHRDYLHAYAGNAKSSTSASSESTNRVMMELHDYVDEVNLYLAY